MRQGGEAIPSSPPGIKILKIRDLADFLILTGGMKGCVRVAKPRSTQYEDTQLEKS